MMKIFIISVLLLICRTGGQPPPTLCMENNPFRLSDHSCESFSEICIKKEDTQCNQLLNACKQCPPSNITLTILRDLLNMSKFQSNFTKEIMEYKIFNTIDKLTSIQQFMANKLNASSLAPNVTSSNDLTRTLILLIIIIIIILIILIVLIVENRFKLITKRIQNCKNKKPYKSLTNRNNSFPKESNENTANELRELNVTTKSTKSRNESLTVSRKEKLLKDLERKVENLSQKLSDHIQYFQSQPLGTHYATIKFQKEGIEHKHVKLYVHNNHNVVQVKQQICTSLLDANTDDYKKIKLKYNGQILDDNDYLLKNIDSSTDSINYIFDDTTNTSEIIVVKLKGKMRLPEIIQIHKNESIENFLSTIGNFIRSEKFRVYKECIENNQLKLKELISNGNNTNDKLVDYFNLRDGDILNVITIECGELKLTSIFNAIDSYKIEYDNIDLISTFSKNRNNDMTNFIFFYRNEIMDENKFIFQLKISNDSQVNFCEFKRFQDVTKGKSIYMCNKWEIYFATHKENEKVLIKKYDIELNKNWKKEDWLLNELKTFLISKSHRRFIQLNDVYVDGTSFYVSMENMTGGTLSYYLRNYKEFDSKQIINWAAQILEGLNFLHEHKIIHRDLNSSSILVGENNNLKLSNFNLSKYDTNGGPCSILGKDAQLCYIKLRYMAPELLDSKEYGFQCDVWSFGAVLVRIVTDKKPYPRLEKEKAQKKIIDCGKIEYEFPDKFDVGIKSFIDSCFGKNPNSRCTIKDLVENEIIKKSL